MYVGITRRQPKWKHSRARQWQGLARPRRGKGTGFEHTVPGKVTARQLRAEAAAQGGTMRRVAEHAGTDGESDTSDGGESEAEGTSEVGSDTNEDDEREAASGGAHGGTA